LEVLPGPAVPIPPEYDEQVKQALAPPPSPPRVAPPAPPATPAAEPAHAGLIQKDPIPPAEHAANLDEVFDRLVNQITTVPSNNLWTFLLTAALWGWISLATPCVFPMIPITVSLFLKQGQQSAAQAVKLSLVYSLTIILVLGISAIALLRVFRDLSVDPYMNIALGGLFVFFALSLFGMYDITLPGFLLRYTEKRRGAGGYIGTMFGALAFSIVSFTCVAPFLGGFAGMASSGQFAQWELVLGGLTFATAFASPFFVLAIFPSLLKKLPRSGGWLDTVKAVMGFIELAAAFKFFRTAELRLLPRPEYFTYDVVLTAWIVIAAITGVYLLGVFRLPHDEEDKSRVGVTRLLFALSFFGLGVYLLPAIFKTEDGRNQRPRGVVYAWIDAFLLPEPVAAGAKELPWSSDLKATLDAARRETLVTGQPRYVFVDFTGVTCTNCKLNEHQIFPRPDVNDLLRQYALVQLYTDEVPIDFYRTAPANDRDRSREAEANLDFQERAFGTQQLPLYVILEPLATGGVRVVDVYDEGKINDLPRFLEFLRKPLQ
jgi:thiol:disulfide interchange protein DsbD